METIKERIKKAFPPNGRFTADQIADMVGLPSNEIGTVSYLHRTSPRCSRHLLQLCKEGFLYQWVIGVGSKCDLTDNAPSWDLFYIRRDSELAQRLTQNRTIKGYRIR